MAACKACTHYDVCDNKKEILSSGIRVLDSIDVENVCPYFRDRSRFVELSCNFGDVVYHYCDKLHKILDYTVYCVNVFGKDVMYLADSYDENNCEVMEALDDSEIEFDSEDCQLEFEPEDIGKTVFLTREEAEKH